MSSAFTGEGTTDAKKRVRIGGCDGHEAFGRLPPETRITKSLLGSVLDGAFRPGFVSAHDSWSLLSLGPQGWIHISVLVVTRALVVHGALLLIAGV
jgi:hypothetical protein